MQDCTAALLMEDLLSAYEMTYENNTGPVLTVFLVH
jgi:hypothetical protein